MQSYAVAREQTKTKFISIGERFNTVLVIMQSYARDHEEDERQDITTYKAYFETSSSLSMF